MEIMVSSTVVLARSGFDASCRSKANLERRTEVRLHEMKQVRNASGYKW